MAGPSPDEKPTAVPDKLLAEVDVAEILVEGVECRGLIDTGSMVSTISQQFYDDNLTSCPLHPLDSLLKIECADGEYLPYSGYIEVEITMDPEMPEVSECFPLLVVPKTAYNEEVPVLLGMNVLRPLMEKCREKFGPRYLQKKVTATPWWLAFRTTTQQDRQCNRFDGRVGMVKCATVETVRIPANGRVNIPSTVTDEVSFTDPFVMFQPTEKTSLPEAIEVTQAAMSRATLKNGVVMVELCNLGSAPVFEQPNAVLCELQGVKTVEPTTAEMSSEATKAAEPDSRREFLETFQLDSCDLTNHEKREAEDLLWEFRDIFSSDEFDIGHTSTLKHRIDLSDEAPLKQRHRRIPPAMYEEVRNHLQHLRECGIIQESSSPWASPVVLVRKKNGKL